QWAINANTTDAGCAGARRFAFVAGFAPPYAPCPMPEPEPEMEDERRGWRDWFGIGEPNGTAPAPIAAQQSEQAHQPRTEREYER
ncbi:MAG: hypothetical protein M3414_07380, partial [Pseudomonadota bacterium]|nr:hypothetical protein [Pseudomonadota bacterium]